MDRLRSSSTKDFYFDASGRSTYDVGELHYHNKLEIYYLLEGTCRYFIDARTYLLEEGDIVIGQFGYINKNNRFIDAINLIKAVKAQLRLEAVSSESVG